MKLAAPGQVFRQLKNQVVDFGRVRHGMFRRNRPLRVAATGDETGGAGTSFSAIKKSSC
jgi:hypothetical protein